MGRRRMDCRVLVAFIADYLDGSLPAEERFRFEAHLAVCPDCVHYVESYGQAVRLERALLEAEGDLPGAVPDALVAAILELRLA